MKIGKCLGTMLALLSLGGLLASSAQAVPSYARQTGSDCAACHIGGFGPQLTPYGISFKLGGYTDSDGKDGKVPLSGMAVATWTRTAKGNPDPDPALHGSANNNGGLQEASVFLAGRWSEHVGSFIQSTYAGFERKWSLDQMDIRYARPIKLGEQEGVAGLSLNSNPTLTDPFNTLGQWRFPYTESDFGFGQGPSPLLESLAGSTVGVNAYTLWNRNFYGEIGLYNSLSQAGANAINTDRVATANGDPGKFKGVGSYWRLAYFKDMKRDNFSVGLFGFNAGVQSADAGGAADRYRDIGVDASYQFLGNRQHVATLNASYVREWQRLNYTFGQGASDNRKNSLDQFKVAASYHYMQTWGATVGLFETRGSTDAVLYADNRTGRPNTAGYILQADWTPWGKESSWGAPWANVRLGLQYTGYTKFNGASHDFDGSGRNARDNNTLMLFTWIAI